MTEQATDLADLVRAHHRTLIAYAGRWTRNQADAEDAVQDAYVTAVTEMDAVAPTHPLAWLRSVTRHRALYGTRRTSRTVPAGDAIDRVPAAELVDPADAEHTNGGACMADPFTALYVAAALEELQPRQREALRLWAIDGLSWAEVAERVERVYESIAVRRAA
jgi:RNA polymerase sigma-70 factor (ECF subfamily)